MQIQCIESEAEFLGLRESWESLRRQAESSSYFLSYDWIRCCWRELKATNNLRICVGRLGERPVLIAPLMRSRDTNSRLPATALTFIEHPETQVSDMLLAAGSDGDSALRHLFTYLLTKKGLDWSILLLDKLSDESRVSAYLRRQVEAGDSRYELELSHEAVVLPLNGNWDEYLARQSVRFRKTLRNIVNRVQKLGEIKVNIYQGKQAAGGAIQKLFAVSDASWKLANGVAITSSPERMRFFSDLLDGKATADGLRIVTLELDGKAIASETQIIDGRVVFALRSDFDERYAENSPGTFLQMEVLRNLFDSGYSEYNFGVGLNPYKLRWGEQRRRHLRFRIYNDTFYGRLLHQFSRCERKLSTIPWVHRFSSPLAGKN